MLLNDSPAMVTFGPYYKQGEEGVVNGPTASVCYVALSEAAFDGFGALKIMYGPKSTRNSRNDGSTWTLVRKHGIIRGCTRKVSRPLFCPNGQQLTISILGWGKKMSYCIAFSADGATDVTRRYVRDAAKHGADRNRCPEEVLVWITDEIKKLRRENLSKEDRRRIIIEDHREEKELRGYVVRALAAEIGRINLSGQPSTLGEEQKVPGRASGTQEWRETRGEAGNGPPHNEQPPREGH